MSKSPGLPVDAAVRSQALDASRSFIVQAPAGSGKTELLTRRVLTLLALVDEPEQVLAITFTRKAASEMRARVMEAIQLASSGEPPEDEYKREGYALARAVLDRDAEKGWQLLKNAQRLNLKTIDSLCSGIAHRMPVMSALGAPAALTENAQPLYREAAARFLDEHAAQLDLVLLQQGNRMVQVQNLLAELLANRDQWQRYVYQDMPMHELRELLENMLQELVESRVQALSDAFPRTLKSELPGLLSKASLVRNALVADDGKVSPAPPELVSMNWMPGGDVSDMPAWEAVADVLLLARSSTKPGVRKSVTRNVGFAVSKADANQAGVTVAELKERKQAMEALLETLREHEDAVALLDEVRRLPPGGYAQNEWELLEQLLRMLPKLLLELQLVFSEAGSVDFVEMALRAQRALGTESDPTDLALAMDLQIKHVLVDEFQDTSRTQFYLYEQLVAGWQPDDGRTFFAVGDPMQSIYRFRDGDVTLFARAQENGIGAVELHPLTLSVNFRAAPCVVDWVNDTFRQVFPAQADAVTGAVPYSPSDAHLVGEGQVGQHAFLDADVMEEAERVASIAAESVAQDAGKSVAILLRNRSHAASIFTALQNAGVPYESVDIELIGDRAVVRDIVSLCLALRYPHDRLHWLSILRAPWCGLTLHDLHALMDGCRQKTLMELLADADRLEQLSDDGRLRVRRFLDVIEPAVQRAARSELMPWVEACWLQLGGPSVCESAVDVDAAERCIQALFELEQRGQLWQPSVIHHAMNTLYTSATASAPVQVMTLHKSKGLEFDTVILPALDRTPRMDTQKLLNWFEAPTSATNYLDTHLLLAPITERGIAADKADRINKMVQQARKRCEEQEKLRLLYVACTRAKSNLHLLYRLKSRKNDDDPTPAKNSLLAPLWPLLKRDTHKSEHPESTIQKTGPVENDNDPESPQPPLLQRLDVEWRMPELDRFSWAADQVQQSRADDEVADIEYTWAGTVARDVGTVVHRQLQRFCEIGEKGRSGALSGLETVVGRQLENMGVPNPMLAKAQQQVLKALRNSLEDERGRWILSESHTEARSEWALSFVGVPNPVPNSAHAESGGNVQDNAEKKVGVQYGGVVIDRTFVDEAGVRWIIDYKTGDHAGGDVEAFLDREQERYGDQLRRYADIIARIDDRPVRVGLYFPMLKGWREFSPDEPASPPGAAPEQGDLFSD